jgi:hypothetical protein
LVSKHLELQWMLLTEIESELVDWIKIKLHWWTHIQYRIPVLRFNTISKMSFYMYHITLNIRNLEFKTHPHSEYGF